MGCRVILGTAGHVDHGKTALVRALTGVDTDRLAEEKRRGITIDLGFAPLRLDGRTIGVVDVPGHEDFVRNMLAGATGVDLALLVIAADEGVMPQTREHLAILDLLGIRGGIIALTKCDLVDDDWQELVADDVRSVVAGTALADAPIVPTSIVSGHGLDALRAAIAAAARAIPERDARDLFRLPVDRAFSVRGTGTVVTGTVWSGALEREAAVRILPAGLAARVRGIESHGSAAPRALPATRVALALAGVDVADVGRGSVLVSDDAWAPTRTVLAEVALLGHDVHPLGPRTAVRFHLGTSDVGARIVTAGGPLAPGARKHARIVLDSPVIARAGDRFVLRGSHAGALSTIGGGVVDDPLPDHRRARPWATPAPTPAARLTRALDAAATRGVAVMPLPVRLGAVPEDVAALLAGDFGGRVIAGALYARTVLAALRERCLTLVDDFHSNEPLEAGAPLQSVRSRLGARAEVCDAIVESLVSEGALRVAGGLVMRHGWSPRLGEVERACRDRLVEELERAGREPPSVGELAERLGERVRPLLRLLEREGCAVAVEPDRYYSAGAVARFADDLRRGMSEPREYSPAELREILGVSRKYLIPFLEYCDRSGITERRASGRTLARTP